MKWMFPYQLVERDSRIILYGAGDVGKEFYLQIHHSNYCKLMAWVDQSFDYYETNYPFAKVKNISDYDFDYIVIAILSERISEQVKSYLLNVGIEKEKIIWSRVYGIGHSIFPQNKLRYLKDWDFYINLIDACVSTESLFGTKYFYQSYPELGIDGIHKIGERIKLFQIDKYLSPGDNVLDIGCNCGFFDLQISDKVKHITGVDIADEFIEIANSVKKYLNISNVDFYIKNVFVEEHNEVYDAIFCIAVHGWVSKSNVDENIFIGKITELLKKGGYLFFASHEVRDDIERYHRLCKKFQEEGMIECMHAGYSSGGSREITLFKKII